MKREEKAENQFMELVTDRHPPLSLYGVFMR